MDEGFGGAAAFEEGAVGGEASGYDGHAGFDNGPDGYLV